MITLTPTASASKRTKNRLREHPGPFELLETRSVSCFSGQKAHRVNHPDGWSGWLPVDEVVVTPLETPDAP